MPRKDNPDLAPDAVLATDLGDEVERHAKQVAEMGGDIDEIDSFDATDLDDGSVLPDGYDPLNPAPAASPDDEETDAGEKDDEEKDDEEEDEADDDSKDPEDESSEDDADGEADGDDADNADDTSDDDESSDDDDADDKPAPKGIPKHRFDEVNEKRKDAEARADRLQAQIDAGKDPKEEDEPFDIMAGEKEYMDLLLDGDTEGALAKRVEVDTAKEAKWKSETRAETKGEMHVEAADQELLALSVEAEGMFDVFNPDHDDYNQPMLDKVLVFMKGYEATGEMTRGDAFVAGLADVVEMYGLMPEEEEALADEADVDEEKPTGKKKVDKKKAKLKEQAHTPVGGEGSSSADSGVAAPNVETMTDEEFDALPEKAQARLRGDIL